MGMPMAFRGGATPPGWTLYPPLSLQMGVGMDMAIFAVHIMGASSIMGSIDIITTLLNMRVPGMTQFTDSNMIPSIGAFGFGLSQAYFLFAVVLPNLRGGEVASVHQW